MFSQSNEDEIIAAVVALGGRWIPQPPESGFDGIAVFDSGIHVVEIKAPAKPPSARKLTANEKKRQADLDRLYQHYNIALCIGDIANLKRYGFIVCPPEYLNP